MPNGSASCSIAKSPSATSDGCGPGCALPGCAIRPAVEDVDYRAARGLDRTLFQTLIAGRWIDAAQNLVIEGPADPAS